MSQHEQCIEILQRTNDGKALSPIHLRLIQEAVNYGLTEAGEIALNELHQNAIRGYKPEWFHGIQYLTIDHEGFVYWKDIEVEHFNPSWAYSYDARIVAMALAERCRTVEIKGEKATTLSVVWNYKYAESL